MESSNEKQPPRSLSGRINSFQKRVSSKIKKTVTALAKRFSKRRLQKLLSCCLADPPVDNPSVTQADNGIEVSITIPDTVQTPIDLSPIDSSNQEGRWLLPPVSADHAGRMCLVLDLDETLIHSAFEPIDKPDFMIPVEILGRSQTAYVLKRPWVDNFMKRMGELFEIVVFTASVSEYADPVLDLLDIHHVVSHRLFRESCVPRDGGYVKNLSSLGRDLHKTIILDNSPASYVFHTANAVPVSSWFNDPHDTELNDLTAFLEDLTSVDDVTDVLDNTLEPIDGPSLAAELTV